MTKIKTRLEMDDRKLLHELSKILNARPEEVPKALERLKHETEHNERRIRELARG